MPTLEERIQARLQTRSAAPSDPIEDRIAARLQSRFGGVDTSSLRTDGTPGPAFREDQDYAPPAPIVQAVGVPGTPNEFVGNNPVSAMPPAETIGGDILAGLNRGGPLVNQQVSGAMATAGQYIPGALGRRLTEYGTQGVGMAQGAIDQFPAPRTFAGQMAEAVPGLAAAVGVGVATAGAGLPAVAGTMAGAGAIGAQTAGGTFVQTRDRLGGQGAPQELVDQAAAAQALPSGIFGAITGTLPIGRILGRVMPGASVPLGSAMERFASTPIGRRLVEAAVGGSQNAAQEVFNNALRIVAEDDPATADNILRGAGQAALMGGLMTAGTAEVMGALGGREQAPPAATPEVVATTRAGTPEVPPQETGTQGAVSDQVAPRDGSVPVTSAEALDAARAIRERMAAATTQIESNPVPADQALPRAATESSLPQVAAAGEVGQALMPASPDSITAAAQAEAQRRSEPSSVAEVAPLPDSVPVPDTSLAQQPTARIAPDGTDPPSATGEPVPAPRPVDAEGSGPPRSPKTDSSFDSMTPAQLRREAKERGLDSRGTKAQLLERLQESQTPTQPTPDRVVFPTQPASQSDTLGTGTDIRRATVPESPTKNESSSKNRTANTSSEPGGDPQSLQGRKFDASSTNPSPATGAKDGPMTMYDVGYHGRSNSQDPKKTKFVSLTSDGIKNRQYAARGVMYKVLSPVKPTEAGGIAKKVFRQWNTDQPPGWAKTSFADFEKSFNPDKIVNSAGYWDEPAFVSWFWEKAGEIPVIKTHDGHVVLDKEVVTYTPVDKDTLVPPEVLADYPDLAKAAPVVKESLTTDKAAPDSNPPAPKLKSQGENASKVEKVGPRKYTQIPKDWHGASLYAWNNVNEVQLAKGKRLPAESRGAVRPMRSMPKAYRDSLGTVPTDAARLIDWIKSKTPEVWKLEGTAGRGKTLVPLELIDAAKEAVPDWQADVSAAQARRQARRDLIDKNRLAKAHKKNLDEARTWTPDEWAEYEAINPAGARELADMLDQQDIANGKEAPDFAADIIDDAAKRARGESPDDGVGEEGSVASSGERDSNGNVGSEAGRYRPWLDRVSDAPPPHGEPTRKEEARGVFGQEGIDPITGRQQGMFGDIDAAPEPAREEQYPGIRHGESVAAYNKRMGTTDTPEMFGENKPTLADRAVSKLDQIAADAKERIKNRPGVQRGGPKGSRAGQGPIIGDTVDTAVYAAAKALSLTIDKGQDLTRVVANAIKELGVTVDPKHVRRIARGLIRDTLAEKPENHADAFERAAEALRDKYSREPKPSETKTLVRQNTGQTPQAKTITESQALKASIKAADRTARIVDRQARDEERTNAATTIRSLREKFARQRGMDQLEARADKEGAVQTVRGRQELADAIRAETLRVANTMPAKVRGALTSSIANATTPSKMIQVLRQLETRLYKSNARTDYKRVLKLTGPSVVRDRKGMTQDGREILRAIRKKASDAVTVARTSQNLNDLRAASVMMRKLHAQAAALLETQGRVVRRQSALRAMSADEKVIQSQTKMRVDGDTASGVTMPGLADKKVAKIWEKNRRFWDFRSMVEKIEGVDGPLTQVWHDLEAGDDSAKAILRDQVDALDRAAARAGFKDHADALRVLSGADGKKTPTLTVRLDGKNRELTLGQAIGLYAHGTDPDTIRLIKGGEQEFAARSAKTQPTLMSESELLALSAAIDPKYRKLVDDIKGIMEQTRDAQFKVRYDLTGVEPEPVEGRWPRPRDLSGVQRDAIPEDPTQIRDGLLENAGRFESRVQTTSGSILFEDPITTALREFEASANIIGMGRPVRDAANVILDKNFKRDVTTRLGTDLHQNLVKQLISIYSPPKSAGGSLTFLNSAAAVSALGVNPGAWWKQIASMPRLGNSFSARDIAAGIAAVKGGKVPMERLTKASGYFWDRYKTGYAERASGIAPGAKARDWAQKPLEILNYFDGIVSRAAFGAAEAKARRKNPGASEAEINAKAIEDARRWVRENANGRGALDASVGATEATQNGGSFMYLFSSDAIKTRNRISRAFRRGPAEGAKVLARETASVYLGYLGARAIWDGFSMALAAAFGWDDDDAERFAKRWSASSVALGPMKEFADTVVPLVGKSTIEGLGFAGRGGSGQVFSAPALDLASAPVVELGRALRTSFNEDANTGKALAAWAKFANSTAAAAGVNPFAPVLRRMIRELEAEAKE